MSQNPDRPTPPPTTANSAEKAEILLAILGQEKLEALRKKGLDLGQTDAVPQGGGTAKATAEILARHLIARLADKPPADTKPDHIQPQPSDARVPPPVQKHRLEHPIQGRVQYPTQDKAATPKLTAPHMIPRKRPDREALLRRVSQYVTPQTLPSEHPAVIAHLLLRQEPEHRMAVLRALPGPKARAVAHFIGLMKPQGPKAKI